MKGSSLCDGLLCPLLNDLDCACHVFAYHGAFAIHHDADVHPLFSSLKVPDDRPHPTGLHTGSGDAAGLHNTPSIAKVETAETFVVPHSLISAKEKDSKRGFTICWLAKGQNLMATS